MFVRICQRSFSSGKLLVCLLKAGTREKVVSLGGAGNKGQAKNPAERTFRVLLEGIQGLELSQGSNKEKLFPAQTKSVLLPDFRVSTLNKKTINLASKLEGKVSLLGVSFVRYGESQAESFLSSPSVVKEADQIIRWNIQENPLKGALVYLSKPYIRRNIDPSNWDNYWIYYGNLKFWRLSIGITNTFLGWVMLVDRNLRVRWLANGVATPEELEQLLDLTKSLKQEDQ